MSVSGRDTVDLRCHDLPFENNSFDGVIAQAVLQYVVEPSGCLHEIERVLKPRGLVYAESAFMQQVVHGRYDFTRFTTWDCADSFAFSRGGQRSGDRAGMRWRGRFNSFC